jgi:penicillin-binding protein 1A
MRQAVAKRPVEQFDTDLRLPEWQLEPDEEDPFGDPTDYYYVDEDGNLIDPRELEDYDPAARRPEGIDAPGGGSENPPPAVDPEFLDRAINGTRQPPPPATRQAPQQQPAPSPTPNPRTTSRPVTQPTD